MRLGLVIPSGNGRGKNNNVDIIFIYEVFGESNGCLSGNPFTTCMMQQCPASLGFTVGVKLELFWMHNNLPSQA